MMGPLLFVPEGFVPIAWTNRPAGSMKDRDTSLSVMHLHDPKVPMRERRDRGGAYVEGWKALCGVEAPYERRKLYRERQAREAPKHCSRCLLRAAERVHVVTFRTHRTGVGNRYGRGASGSGGRNTHAACSCGWTNRSNVTKREQVANYRGHLRDVVEGGLFLIERDRYPTVMGGEASAVGALMDAHAATWDELLRDVRGLVAGEAIGKGEMRVERVEMPWARREPR